MRFCLVLLVLVCGCLPTTAPLPEPRAEPAFRPEVFFAGRSSGDPILAIRTKSPQNLRVESFGETQPDGTFRLDQTITYPDGHDETRTWVMTPLGDGRYSATLTPDATGAVEVTADGNRLHIRYPMSGGLRMDQTLALRPDGQVADNVATVRWMGMMPVARLVETITRKQAPGAE